MHTENTKLLARSKMSWHKDMVCLVGLHWRTSPIKQSRYNLHDLLSSGEPRRLRLCVQLSFQLRIKKYTSSDMLILMLVIRKWQWTLIFYHSIGVWFIWKHSLWVAIATSYLPYLWDRSSQLDRYILLRHADSGRNCKWPNCACDLLSSHFGATELF